MAGMEPLEHYLDRHGITQAKFAERVGASRSFINEIVRGRKLPGRDLALRISEATDGEVAIDVWRAPGAAA